ncbi:DPOLN-like protein [Mya arenaria]|uniref:DPOLN-like protein n=1 Tax=Mya arenaria TaxID=6604 RepID=A0ABY7FIV5_MYAAR|nr:DPOLN-like protein [Mya arenaria]
MSSVWTPADAPPRLDRFCHLSVDAQRVMASLFSDFHQQRAEMIMQQAQTPGVADPQNYYRSIYEAKFGKYVGPKSTTPASKTLNSSENNFQMKKNVFAFSDNDEPKSTRYQKKPVALSQDTSNYSDSPPVETQDFRLLSQFHDEDNLKDTYEYEGASEAIPIENNRNVNDQLNTDVSNVRNGCLLPSLASFRIVDDENETDISGPCIIHKNDYTKAKNNSSTRRNKEDDMRRRDTAIDKYYVMGERIESSLIRTDSDGGQGMNTADKDSIDPSQCLFSQDIPVKQRNRNKKAKPLGGKTVSEVQPIKFGDSNKTTSVSCTSSKFQEFSPDFNIGNFQFSPVFVSDTEINPHSVLNQNGDNSEANLAFIKGDHSYTVFAFNKKGGNSDALSAIKTNIGDPESRKADEIIARQQNKASELKNECEQMNLNTESPYSTSPGVVKRNLVKQGTLAGFLDDNLTEMQKNNQPDGRKFTVTTSENPLDKNSKGSKKRPTSNPGFSVPVKKPRKEDQSYKIKPGRSQHKQFFSQKNTIDLGESSREVIEQVQETILSSSTVVISLVIFWEKFLGQRSITKIGMHLKDTLIEILHAHGFCHDKVSPDWVLYDVGVGWWLLDPDKPVNSFPQLLTALHMPQQAPSESSLSALSGDMALLGVAWNRVKQKLENCGLWSLYHDLEAPLTPLLAAMEMRPLTVATHTLLQLSDILKKKLVQLEQQAHKAAGRVFLLSSHHQLRQLEQQAHTAAGRVFLLSSHHQLRQLEQQAHTAAARVFLLSSYHQLRQLEQQAHTAAARVFLLSSHHQLRQKLVQLEQLAHMATGRVFLLSSHHQLRQLEQHAHTAAARVFLLSSYHQLRQVLFEELKLDLKLPNRAKLAKTSVGKETSTSEAVLTQLAPLHDLPAIVLEHRQLQKLKSTYIDGMLSCVRDGALYTHWDQTAAATGRLTSYQPNIQAIPKLPVTIGGLKTCFIPDKDSNSTVEIYARDPFVSRPGYTFIAADFQQIELRLLGHLADDPMLLKLFNDPDIPDIFTPLTAQWLGKAVESITSTEREQTKRVVYSIMYGVGKEKLAEYLKISADNAKAIMASFLVKFPAVGQFTKSCLEFCRKNGYTCSIFRRHRLFPNISHSNHGLRAQAERQCVNFCVQGSAADVCKAAMLKVEGALAENPNLDARLLVQIHDELLLEAEDSQLKTVIDLVKSVMEEEKKFPGFTLKVPTPVSISTGKKWGHLSLVEHPV